MGPIPIKRPMQVAAKEKLQNGDMAALGLFGNEFSIDKVEIKRSLENEVGVDLQDHQGSSESASDEKPVCHGLENSEALSRCQRKLAVEEMVIRDHLGQEVGSMDAVGQAQRSIGKEEHLEDYSDLENRHEEGSRPSPLCNVFNEEEASTANKSELDYELGNRDGPEGESPTSQDHQSPSKSLQNCATKQGVDEELEMGSLTQEATADSAEPEKKEQDNLTSEKRLQEFLGSDATALGQGEEGQEPFMEQLQSCLSDETPTVQETNFPKALEEARVCLLEQATSAFLTAQVPEILQDPISSLQDTKEPLLDQIPSSFQEIKSPLLDPVISSLSNQSLPTILDQTLQEGKKSHPVSDLSSLQAPLLDSNPPTALQDSHFSSVEQQTSSLQGEATAPQETIQAFLDQIPSPTHEVNEKLLDQSTSPPDQTQSTLPGHFTALSEQNSSSLREESLQISAALQDQEHSVLEANLPDTFPPLTDQVSSMPNQIISQEAGELSSEDITVILQDQIPVPPEDLVHSLPESDNVSLGHILSLVDENKLVLPEASETSVPDQFVPPVQDQKSTFPGDETSALHESGGSIANQVQASLPNQTSSNLEAKGLPEDQTQPPILEQLPVHLDGQTSLLQENEQSLSELQNLSAQEEMPILPEEITSPNKAGSSTLQDAVIVADVLLSSSHGSDQPLLEKTAIEEDQKVTESGYTSLTSAATVATEEASEILENLPAEQQPLLKELTASIARPDISGGDPQSKMGITKPHITTSQEAPTYTTTSANTASSCPLTPAVPHQGEGQEQGQNRRKQKSCQCCSVM